MSNDLKQPQQPQKGQQQNSNQKGQPMKGNPGQGGSQWQKPKDPQKDPQSGDWNK